MNKESEVVVNEVINRLIVESRLLQILSKACYIRGFSVLGDKISNVSNNLVDIFEKLKSLDK